MDHFETKKRTVAGFNEDLSDAHARAQERVNEFDAKIESLDTAAGELDAELKEIDAAYGTKLNALKAKIDRRYDEMTAQLNAATGVIEDEYGPQADHLMALLAALYDTGDVAGALTAINAIPTHDAAPRLAEAAKLIAALQLAQNQAAALAGPANALWAQVDTLVAQVEASGQTLEQKKAERDALVRERDELIEQKQAEIEQLLAGAPRPQLDVRSLSDHACPNAEFFLEALVPPNVTGLTWTSGGTPSTGAGRIYRTRFSGLPRDEVIELLWDHFTGPIRLLITVPVWALSGAEWWHLFAGSEDVNQLVPSFRDKVKKFKAALEEAGANVKVGSTYRPLQRSYLMHFAWRLVLPPGDRDRVTPDQVPQFNRGLLEPGALETGPVDICRLHRDAAGNPDAPASVAAAQAMKVKYDLKHRPAFPGSKHYVGKAIDLTIEWSGDLKIKDAAGNEKTISSLPRNGDNRDLHAVGATCEIRKLVDDQPHWYED
jgi:tetratricopeptide (TPR) repeat protein